MNPDGQKKVVWVMELKDENARLADVLIQSTKTMVQLLMPAPDLDTPPDDLFPAAAEAQRVGNTDDLPAPTGVTIESPTAEVVEPEITDEERQLDADIEKAFEILGTSEGRRKAELGKPNLDKRSLLKRLNEAIDKLNVDSEAQPEQKGQAAKSQPADSPKPAQTGKQQSFF